MVSRYLVVRIGRLAATSMEVNTMIQEETTTPTSRRPVRQNGWLKMTLATSGIALTILGTGLLAKNDAAAVNTMSTGLTSEVETAVKALPTLVVPNLTQGATTIPEEQTDTSNQLVIPSVTSTNRTTPQITARSRSSR